MNSRIKVMAIVVLAVAIGASVGALATDHPKKTTPAVPEGWLSVGENLAIELQEPDGSHLVGRLMVFDHGVWEPLYLEGIPQGIRHLQGTTG